MYVCMWLIEGKRIRSIKKWYFEIIKCCWFKIRKNVNSFIKEKSEFQNWKYQYCIFYYFFLKWYIKYIKIKKNYKDVTYEEVPNFIGLNTSNVI